MKKVLVTGATGLVGDGISRFFIKNNWIVFGTSRRGIKSLHSNFIPIRLELGEKKHLVGLNSNLPFDAVIHCAAKLPYSLLNDEDIDNYYQCNVLGTRYLLEWASKSRINTFIYISGTGCYDNPNNEKYSYLDTKPNHYHITKAIGEILCNLYKSHGLNAITLRISAPYGYINNESVIPKFIKLAKQNKNIELWGNGSRSQTFTFVEDVGYACELILNNKKVNGIYNISGNELITMSQLAKEVITALPETKSQVVFSGIKDPNENQKDQISFEKAKRDIDFSAKYSLKDGIRKIIKENGRLLWSYN